MATVEERLQALEDQQAIYQVVCGYGYSVDGCNADSVGDRYVENGVYAVGDMPSWVGRVCAPWSAAWFPVVMKSA